MKIICIGRNYADHVQELANEKPDSPVIFLKPDSALLAKKQPFFIPPFTNEVHHELELVIKINRLGKFITQKFAHKYYDQIGLGLDLTARDLQNELKRKGLPWEKAKAFDGAAVVGHKWMDKQKFDLNNLNFQLNKNGQVVQQGNTSLMLWKIDELIAYISTFFTLKIGDLIFTGTPAGVGKISEGDYLEAFLESEKLLDLKIR